MVLCCHLYNGFAAVLCACSASQPSFRSSRPVMTVVVVVVVVATATRVLADDGYISLGWTSQTGTAGYDYGRGVAISGDGLIYVTGYTGASLNGQVWAGIYVYHILTTTTDKVCII